MRNVRIIIIKGMYFMRLSSRKLETAGFSVIEGLLITIAIAAIVGVGGYVLHQKKIANGNLSSAHSGNSTTQTTAQPATGTTANLDQLTQQGGQTEAGVDSSDDVQTSQNATSSNYTINNVEGSYDETTL